MKKLISIIIIFAVFLAVLTFGGFTANAGAPYKEASSWAVTELDKAAGYGFITDKIMNKMNTSITREEFAEIAVKLYERYTGKTASFSDMRAFIDTKNPEVFKAYDLKIVNGTDAKKKLFSPDQPANREQVAAMMFRTVKAIVPDADFSAGTASGFTDKKDVSDWALESVGFMIKNGLLKGEGGKINPKGTCTGEMAVLFAVRIYEKYSSGSSDKGSSPEGDNSYDWDQIVINDTEIFRDNYFIKEKNAFYYIFIEAERFKYAFKLPFAGSYTYPEVDITGSNIRISWSNGEKTVLRVDLQKGNTEALVSGAKIDAGMAPYEESGEMYIPINLFISAMEMDVETTSSGDILYIQYKNAFPGDILAGTWSDTNIDLFDDLKDVTSGSTILPPYATAYRFNDNGTYELRMVSSGSNNEKFIAQRGKYRIMGNTIIFYDILETVYKGVPLILIYEDKSLGRPQYSFIYNYDSKKGRIEIGGFWYNRR
ncbi:MAG TPA: S-layer homology domain-containing protein [Bacillota bacterium]|nr:S-layer homology domain-containing protein [Bacillota bacterium]